MGLLLLFVRRVLTFECVPAKSRPSSDKNASTLHFGIFVAEQQALHPLRQGSRAG